MPELKISAKELGYLAMPDFCPRCFWFKRNAPDGLPFQIFPGIFSSIDSYIKNVVHEWFDRHGSLPSWMPGLASVKKYLKAPWYTKFKHMDHASGMTINGMVDDLFE